MMSTAEMNIQPDEVVVKLRALPQYQSLFRAAFGEKGITTETIVKAIASYERTIISADAPFDRYVKGDDNAISPEARRGFVLFNTKAHCATCHSGWNLSDSSFHDIGVASDDLGRGPIIGLETLNHAFKTPTLRNIQDRAPYTHNGSEKTLRDVVDLYDQGGRVKRATLSAEIKPLNLTEPEKNDLIAFLRTLTSQDAPVTLPVLP
jgi:cytochrome c peroxidase